MIKSSVLAFGLHTALVIPATTDAEYHWWCGPKYEPICIACPNGVEVIMEYYPHDGAYHVEITGIRDPTKELIVFKKSKSKYGAAAAIPNAWPYLNGKRCKESE